MMLTVTEQALRRITERRQSDGIGDLRLRITVDSGGCSGFQYKLSWDQTLNEDDHHFQGMVVTDSISLPFLNGSIVDFTSGLMGSDFKIKNPNATQGCGCGTSFSV